MIDPRAVDRFVEDKLGLRDSARTKRLPDSKLDAKLRNLAPDFDPVIAPYRHQKVAMLLCLRHPRYMLADDMGLGKTYVLVNVARLFWQRGDSAGLCFVVMGSAHVHDVADQIEQFAPEMRVFRCDRDADSATRHALLAEAGETYDAVVITWAGLSRLLCDEAAPTASQKKASKNRKYRLSPSQRRIKKFCERFDVFAFDECSEFASSKQSLYFRLVRQVNKYATRVYLATGTPLGSDPTPLWAQAFLVDDGRAFGATLGLFRAAFYKEKKLPWSIEYEFDKSYTKEVARRLRHVSVRHTDKEVADLPAYIHISRPVDIDAETKAYYNRVIDELVEARGNFKAVDSAWHRMRMLCSGFLPYKDSEGERHVIRFSKRHKLDAVLEDINQLPDNEQVVLFTHYNETSRHAQETLRKKKMQVAGLYGESKDKRALQRFKAGDARVLVVSEASGAFGLNLQFCAYCFVLETPSNYRRRRQMEKRLHRTGQKRRVRLADYYVRGSIEEETLKELEAGRDLFDQIANGRMSAGRLRGLKL